MTFLKTDDNFFALPTFCLPEAVSSFQQRDQETAWANDHEYFEAVRACEIARIMTYRLKANLSESIYSTDSAAFATPESPIVRNGEQLGDMMARLTTELDKKREHMVAFMNSPPLIEKFLDNMDATVEERKVFRLTLVAASGMIPNSKEDFKRYGKKSDMDAAGFGMPPSKGEFISIAEVHDIFTTELSLLDLMSLTSVQSKWVKEQIYERSSRPSSQMSAMSDHVLQAFMGIELTVSQYQDIESTILQNTLLEDERFQNTATGKVVQKQEQLYNMFGEEQTDQDVDLEPGQDVDLEPGQDVELEPGLDFEMDSVEGPPTTLAQALSAASAETGNPKDEKDRLFKILSRPDVIQNEANTTDAITSNSDDALEERQGVEFGPYRSDLDYLEDQVRLMDKEVKFNKAKADIEKDDEGEKTESQFFGMPYNGYGKGSKDDIKLEKERTVEKEEIKLKKLNEKVGTRLRATKKVNKFMPRLEQLCEAMNLERFEKFVILDLIRAKIMPSTSDDYCCAPGSVSGYIDRFSHSLQDKMISRKYFYKSSTLVKEGIITVSGQDFMTDLTDCWVQLDRRMFDFLVGLDTEFSEIVDGSHLYTPNVSLDDVILPQDTKQRICDCVLNFDKVKEEYHRLEIDQKITYGLGQVLLFYGSSGTGKTMLANAIVTKLKKKVLLVNFPTLGMNTSGEIIKFLFREARINKAILFFDECESIFKSRDLSACDSSVNMILSELERFDDLCILATNRPCDLDEAMYRRISLSVEFKKPDHIMRETIWRTLHPPKLPLDDDVDFQELARKYELTGGLIKNAWLQSIGLKIQRGGDKVNQQDLMQAASEQVIGRLSLEDFDRQVSATCGIDAVIASPPVKESLVNIVQHARAQSVLFGQWGFGKVHRATTGVSALFCGAPGTGKSMAAEAIGFDLGSPLKVVNVAQLVSKWVGETGKNIEAVFNEAKAKNAILVFDEAEGLFGKRQLVNSSVDRHDTLNVGLLLRYIEHFSGVCIVITNQKGAVDEAFFRRFHFVLEFEQPNAQERLELWQIMIPKECPLAPDVSLELLAEKYRMCGGDIKSALFRAATRAALREHEKDRALSMKDLEDSCDEEIKKVDRRNIERSMYA